MRHSAPLIAAPSLLSRATNGSVPVPGERRDAKKIVFFTSCSEPWGGSEELWAGAAERLQARSFSVLAVRSCGPEELHCGYLRLSAAGIRLRGSPLPWWTRIVLSFLRRLRRWKLLPRGRVKYAAFMCELRAFGPKLAVISQGETYDGINDHMNLAKLCADAGVPYVLVCQKAYEDLWPCDKDRGNFKKAFASAERVFFVSEHNRRCTQWQLASALPNAEVISNPFIVEADKPLPWPRADGDVMRLACVARLWTKDKGQDLLLAVLARDEWRGRRLEVNFYGLGENARGLEETAAMLGLSNVRFCGYARDVTQVWREHHALILPSRHEGLPLVLVEAMICGRPGIVTNAGGAMEIVTDGETGFIAATADADALSEAMERAWNRRHEWKQMGLDAARTIRQRVPRDPCGVFADKLAAIYSGMNGGGAPARRAAPHEDGWLAAGPR